MIYFKEIFIINFILLLILLLIGNFSSLQIIFISLIFLCINLFSLNYIGNKRSKEINEIRSIIIKIRNKDFSTPDDIRLNINLQGLQDEIQKMFLRSKEDIEYLKRLERIRTEFLANVSHELRTPIFAIQGYIETLLNGAINDKKVNLTFLEKANNHTISLSNLLNDLIDISMIESGEMRMSYRYFKIVDALESVVSELLPQAQEKNISLELIPVRENLQLFGDKTKLRQVFVNLIQNAIKYTEVGKVEVLVLEEGKIGRIIIRDTGIGISQDDLPRIFERFYRVDKNRSRSVGGTGLGLAIAKHIAEAHGTKIEVISEPGKGSEFSINLKK